MKKILSLIILLLLTACAGSGATGGADSAVLAPTLAPTGAGTLPPVVASPTAAGYPFPATSAVQPSEAYPAPQTTTAQGEATQPPQGYPVPATPGAENPTSSTSEPTLVPAIAFDAERAYRDLEYQMSLGPRTPGSPAHTQVIEWMQSELAKSGWTVELQETTQNGQPVRNVIAKRGSGSPWTILGAHFDSRMKADRDPDAARHGEPVPGANDGASGVAVLMELSRTLPADLEGQVWLAFFDSEDQGDLPGWDWILGSRALAESLTGKPDAVIIVDMIGDANLNLPQERNSDPALVGELWNTAARLGYGSIFLPQPGYAMLDDHTPFLEKGIRAADIIDFDYPYWHTTQDTADKVSPQSLKAIGDTVGTWLVLKK